MLVRWGPVPIEHDRGAAGERRSLARDRSGGNLAGGGTPAGGPLGVPIHVRLRPQAEGEHEWGPGPLDTFAGRETASRARESVAPRRRRLRMARVAGCERARVERRDAPGRETPASGRWGPFPKMVKILVV